MMRGRKTNKKKKQKFDKSTVSSNKIAVSCPIASLWKKGITPDSAGKKTSAHCLQSTTGDSGSVAL